MTQKPPGHVPFDSLMLYACLPELLSELQGGQIQDIRQPHPPEVRLEVRHRGRTHHLLLSADVRFGRAHLTAHRAPNAPVPPAFCMALRKHLEGTYVRDIRQRGRDRILEIETGPRDPDVAPCLLIAELMGKHSNLILVRPDGVVVDAAKRIGRRINRFREVLPGVPYLSPPKQASELDPFAPEALERLLALLAPDEPHSAETLGARLLTHCNGFSPFLARETALRTFQTGAPLAEGLSAAWKSLMEAAAAGRFKPTLFRDARDQPVGAYPFPSVQFATASQRAASNLQTALDAAYAALEHQAAAQLARQALQADIRREEQRLQRRQESLLRTLEESPRAERYRQDGELLLAHLAQIQPGDTQITVRDYYDEEGRERLLELDPRCTPAENAEAYFRRFRKARDSQEIAATQQHAITSARERMAAYARRLESSGSAAEIAALRAEMETAGVPGLDEHAGPEGGRPTGRALPDFQGHKIRRQMTPEGYEIYIGESATANDYLTTRLAAPDDIWLHVRAASSAHVVIRARGRPEAVPRSVLEQAARLCARQSSQKHSALVAVDYTLKKYVRKPRGAPPGSVSIREEKTLHVSDDRSP